MNTTDELREFVRGADGYELWCPRHRAELLAIADRIDSALIANGYIELPKDANDEYICPGDVMDGYGKTIEVVELRYGRSGWVLISRDGNGYADTFAFAHHHEPTVDELLDQLDGLRGNGADYEDVVTRASEIAEKLRELLKEDA
jgi:hypothetical protein